MRYECFHLVLMVTHACNLRCTYCYTGTKLRRSMSYRVARAAIDRAVRSIRPSGTLEMGFFGGEPLIEAKLLSELVAYARLAAAQTNIRLRLFLTTNGTIDTPAAWDLMTLPEMKVSVSHDGLPEAHDRHRRRPDGRGTSERVLATIRRLLADGHQLRAVVVVRPDTVAMLAAGIAWLWEHGIRRVDPTLDLWTRWDRRDAAALAGALAACADLWVQGLPDCGISWFDDKAGRLSGVPAERTARCAFGDGQIAVAPSGNLYPCERLIGEDRPDNAMRLPGHALDAGPFRFEPPPARSLESCSACAIQPQCNTSCRCSNYVRTGDVDRPDGLLCLLDQVCYRQTVRVLNRTKAAFSLPVLRGGEAPCKTTRGFTGVT
jgi:uncharacterized protein